MVSPIILPAKRLLQDLCKQGIGWDEEIGAQEFQSWSLWLSDLPLLSSVALPRCLKPVDLGQIQDAELHHFVDTSQIAYGTVSHVRLVENGCTHCGFLAGKSCLAYMKQMTKAILGLSDAVLSVRMNQTLQEEFQLKFDGMSLWTDSTTIHQYIKNEDKRFYTSVANRLTVIHNGSEPSQWNYVPTNINPVDNVSRGLTVRLLNNERWFRGPAFLWEDKSSWPINPISLANISDEDPVVRTQGQTNHLTQDGGKMTIAPNDAPIFLMVQVQESCCLASEIRTVLKGKGVLASFITCSCIILWQTVFWQITTYRGSNHQVCAEISLLTSD